MEAEAKRLFGRETWGEGPWSDEPDRVEFEHEGFPCLIHRVPLGQLCGYVAVPPGHPWHGKHYDNVDASAHGGLTFSGPCKGHICHAPKPGDPDDVWWFGFDAAHSADIIPGLVGLGARAPSPRLLEAYAIMEEAMERRLRPAYRTVGYMRAQCEQLAEQAKAAAP